MSETYSGSRKESISLCAQRGAKGLKATIATLDSLGIAHIGTYADDSARVRALPKIVSINNIKFGFLNYTCFFRACSGLA